MLVYKQVLVLGVPFAIFNTWAITAQLKAMGNRCLSRPARIRGWILTMYTSCDVFRQKEMLFWGRVDTASHIGSEIHTKPRFWRREYNTPIRISSLTRTIVKFAYRRNYWTESSQILHSDKRQQILFVGGPSAYNKSKMDDGRHFENS